MLSLMFELLLDPSWAVLLPGVFKWGETGK